MKNSIELDYFKIKKVLTDLSGVLTISDLKIILNCNNIQSLFNRIKRLESLGLLQRFSRGIYISPNFSKEILSYRIESKAYISCGNALSKYGLIGTIPDKKMIAIKIGKNRVIENLDYKIEQFSIAPHLYFGFTRSNGVLYADKEKAYIDTLYYYMKGHRFSFNPFEDINLSEIEEIKFLKYLSKYKNNRFIKFCKDLYYDK